MHMQLSANDTAHFAAIETVAPTVPKLCGDREMDAERGRRYANEVVTFMRSTGNLPFIQRATAEATRVDGPFKRAYFVRLAELLVQG